MGKGSRTRPVDRKHYDENFEKVFGPRVYKRWNPETDETEEIPLVEQRDVGGDNRVSPLKPE